MKENDPGGSDRGAKRRSPVLTVFGTHKQKLHVDSLRADFVHTCFETISNVSKANVLIKIRNQKII